jgi:hypothetical protein
MGWRGDTPPPGWGPTGGDAATIAQLRKELADAKAEAASWRNRANDTDYGDGSTGTVDERAFRRLRGLLHTDRATTVAEAHERMKQAFQVLYDLERAR